ncbi:hypothetical protein NliqN6_1022 [Naganishia liquefaciens]|uniref:Uncharacterized protein n=1 Tax=Naganishia liquefaciens TaxID=104408 RepID=A0A8H3TP35_9TREE|nr:hypothetical protein NliqN6_1022 [Naganishia liquefaciens]
MFIRHCVKSTSRSASTLSRVEASVTRSSLSARTLPHRYLSSSASRLASQEDEFASAFEQSPLFNVIKSHPTAMEAIRDIGDLMQKKGIDLTQPPSKMTLMKLAMDGEFRIAITKVMTELKQAGVDVTPENVQQLMGPLGKK